MVSLISLMKGGVPMLDAIAMNHHIDKLGEVLEVPLNRWIFREWKGVYECVAKKNIADDENACLTVIRIEALGPELDIENKLIMIIAMWATDE